MTIPAGSGSGHPSIGALLRAAAIFAILTAAAFWPVVLGSRSFFHGDLLYEHVPIWEATQNALLRGESPFWIDGHYCGNPLLFTQEAPIFYPVTVPLLLTGAPAHRLTDVFSLFHFWLAGLGAFLLLRDRGSDPLSSLFAGAGWMLSARLLQSAIWPNAVAALALLPFVLLGLLRIIEGRRRSGIAWTAISGGLCLLAARPQTLIGATPLFAVVMAAALLGAERRKAALRDLAIAGALAAALGAPAVWPSAALYSETARAGGLSRAERDLNSLASGKDIDQVFLPVDGPRRWPEAAAYPGFLVAILFIVGIIVVFSRRGGFNPLLFMGIAVGGALGLVAAFGSRGPLAWLGELPVFSGFRIPARYLVSWSLALVFGSALVLAHLLRTSRRPILIGVLCVSVLAADLTIHARRAAPTGPSALYGVEPALVSFVRSALAPDEVGFPRRLWSRAEPPRVWLFERDEDKLEIVRRFEPLYGAVGLQYGIEAVGGAGPPLARWMRMFRDISKRRAELAGVGALVFPARDSPIPPPGTPQRHAVERFTGLPRAIVVPTAVIVPPGESVVATLDEKFDPRRTVVLEEGEPMAGDERWASSPARVRLLSRAPGRLVLAATLPGRGVLVVFDTFEKGWTAKIDGHPARVLAADGAFRGLRLSPGEHVVELRYRPPLLRESVAASAAGLLGLLLVALRTAS